MNEQQLLEWMRSRVWPSYDFDDFDPADLEAGRWPAWVAQQMIRKGTYFKGNINAGNS